MPARSPSRALAAAWTRQTASAGASRAASQFASSGGASGRTPARAEQLGEGRVEPGAEMDAVRDVADRRLLAGPERRPHLARDLAVQIGDTVRVGGEAQREGRQPEAGLVAEAAQLQQALAVEPALGGEVADVADDELLVEDLVARRNRRVRREDGRPPDRLERIIGVRTVRDERAQAFELEECRVPLVQVEDVRVDPERRERADAADAEQQLLADAVLAIAAVERVGEPVDLEQVERARRRRPTPRPCARPPPRSSRRPARP